MSFLSVDNDNELAVKNEVESIRQRYDRRQDRKSHDLYSMMNPDVYMSVQERERGIIHFLNTFGIPPLNEKKVLEIGCGFGNNLSALLRLGFCPENLVGNELLEERVSIARKTLPEAIRIIPGDALDLAFESESFDVVYQSTVFTSILDYAFQRKLANKMWSLVKLGGAVLWYDFIYDNPQNPDVKGVPIKRIKELFPYGQISTYRLTLAPPISRWAVKIHPRLYTIFNSLPFLRTHVLCWIQKV